MARGRRSPPVRPDLDVLDPDTGQAVVDASSRTVSARPTGLRRRRAAALTLAAASIACALAAAYFALAIRDLRRIERAWSEAMAVDAGRAAADGRMLVILDQRPVIDRLEREAALGAIGDEAALRLGSVEARLAATPVLDHRIADLRDRMIAALRFRRFQLTPQRRVMGDTPLAEVERDLGAALDRYGLDRSHRPPVALTAGLDHLTGSRPTTRLSVVTSDNELVTFDLNSGTPTVRALGYAPDSLLAVGRWTIVAGGGMVTAYPLDADQPAPAWDGDAAVAARDGSGIWIVAGSRVRLITLPDDERSAALELSVGARLVADTNEGLVVVRGGAIDLVDRDRGTPVRRLAEQARFVTASATAVAVQPDSGPPRLTVHALAPADDTIDVDLPRTDAANAVLGQAGDRLVIAAGPVAGNVASVLEIRLRPAVTIRALGGPRVPTRPNTLAIAGDSSVFWITPDGRLAAAIGGSDGGVLRSPVDDVTAVVAIDAPG